jgi:hypothetical protein
MIRKLKSGKFRLYSRKLDPKTGRTRNLGAFDTREQAEKHERAVQFFKRRASCGVNCKHPAHAVSSRTVLRRMSAESVILAARLFGSIRQDCLGSSRGRCEWRRRGRSDGPERRSRRDSGELRS